MDKLKKTFQKEIIVYLGGVLMGDPFSSECRQGESQEPRPVTWEQVWLENRVNKITKTFKMESSFYSAVMFFTCI